jgi:hypothetical protein
MNKKKFTKLK